MNIAIVGATGNVGRKLLEVLEKLNFEFSDQIKALEKKLLLKTKLILLLDLVILILQK